jgi:hypothetical protein
MRGELRCAITLRWFVHSPPVAQAPLCVVLSAERHEESPPLQGNGFLISLSLSVRFFDQRQGCGRQHEQGYLRARSQQEDASDRHFHPRRSAQDRSDRARHLATHFSLHHLCFRPKILDECSPCHIIRQHTNANPRATSSPPHAPSSFLFPTQAAQGCSHCSDHAAVATFAVGARHRW